MKALFAFADGSVLAEELGDVAGHREKRNRPFSSGSPIQKTQFSLNWVFYCFLIIRITIYRAVNKKMAPATVSACMRKENM
ncbi:hypothetical protein AZ46_0203185 [Metabacillus indicus LMG 22858]|nr:hypothetical protein AZ46_0203185 [Metabacillus indicus LMG 22858]